ncbi:MAG: MBL fold metallo-hydrolase [Chitinophagaceae bacterium]
MKIFLLTAALSFSLQSHSPVIDTNKLPAIHYFYNSGWMIETKGHAIVIDFIPHAASGSTMDYLEGLLKQAASRGKKIVVMITHDHQDHFNPAILQLGNNIPGVQYILGWNYKTENKAQIKIMNARDSLTTPAYKVYSHVSTDDGVGFLLQIDGLNIYHAGDHALWAEQLLQQFRDELNFIRSKTKNIDLAFIPAARGMFTKCAYDSIMEKGIKLSAEILRPDVVALQHVGCEDKLTVYRQAYTQLNKETTVKKWIIPAKFNQEFAAE